MINPGRRVLAALSVTTPVTNQAMTPIAGLDGMLGCTLTAVFLGGAGGSSLSALAQSSPDGGNTWLDAARFDFTNAGGVKTAQISGIWRAGVKDYAALGAPGVNHGLLFGDWRAVITSVGIYSNTNFALYIQAR